MTKNLRYRMITLGIIAVTAILWIAWDIFVAFASGNDATESRVFLWLSVHPILPFAMGVLMGHFFAPMWVKQMPYKTDVDDAPDGPYQCRGQN